jgi:hypothetical protein
MARSFRFREPSEDDLGKSWRLVSIAKLRWDARRADPAFAAAAHRAQRAVVKSPHAPTVIGLMLALVLIYVASISFMPASAALWTALLVLFPLMLLGSHWVRHRPSRGSSRRAADVLLADGVCPRCSYNLAGLPDTDGVTVCSECGAAWRTTRIARRHTFAARPLPSGVGPLGKLWEWAKSIEFQGPTSIDDDRGDPRPIVSPRLIWIIRAAGGERRERLQAARAEMLQHGRGHRRFYAVLMPCFFVLALSIKAAAGFRPGDAPVMAIILLNCVQAPLMMLRGAYGIKPEHIRSAMLGARCCPACAADLDNDSATAQHGDTVCLECGAVWQVTKP